MRIQYTFTNTFKKKTVFLPKVYAFCNPFSFSIPFLFIVFLLGLLSSCTNTTTITTPTITKTNAPRVQAIVGTKLLGAADIVELDPNGTDKLVAKISVLEGNSVITSGITFEVAPTLTSITGVSVEVIGGAYQVTVAPDIYTDELDKNYILTITIGNTTKTRKLYIKRKIPIVPVKSLALTRITGQENTVATVGVGTVDLTTVFTVNVVPINATDSSVTWSISSVENTVATLTPQGILSPIAEGTVNIIVTSVSDTGVSSTAVPFIVEALVPVTGITLIRIMGQENITATVGVGTVDLTTVFAVNVAPSDATNPSVTWSISPLTDTIATLTPQGVLTPVAVGTVNIIVTSVSDVGVSSTAVPFAVEAFVQIIGLNLSRIAGQENTKAKVGVGTVDLTSIFTILIVPNNATIKDVNWSINPAMDSIATLTTQGILTPVAEGIVNIIVTSASDTGVSSAPVSLTIEVPVTGLTLARISGQENTKGLVGMGTVDLTSVFEVTVTPTNATDSRVTWSISPTMDTIATLNNAGVLTPLATGNVNIIITSVSETGVSSTAVPFTIEVPVTGLMLARITGQENTKAEVGGGTVDLTSVFGVTVTPANATNPSVIWSISPTMDTVATLRNDGVLIPVDAGTVNIIVTSVSYTGVSSTAVPFTIVIPVTGLTLSRISGQENTKATVGGGTVDLTSVFSVTVTPTNATDSSITWSISPTMDAIATLSNTGILTPVAAGTVNIIVTSISETGVSSTPVTFIVE